jgi:hypothetical protein
MDTPAVRGFLPTLVSSENPLQAIGVAGLITRQGRAIQRLINGGPQSVRVPTKLISWPPSEIAGVKAHLQRLPSWCQ